MDNLPLSQIRILIYPPQMPLSSHFQDKPLVKWSLNMQLPAGLCSISLHLSTSCLFSMKSPILFNNYSHGRVSKHRHMSNILMNHIRLDSELQRFRMPYELPTAEHPHRQAIQKLPRWNHPRSRFDHKPRLFIKKLWKVIYFWYFCREAKLRFKLIEIL